MSVEITGPQAYEWQYRMTAVVAVQNIEAESLIVEAVGGEDAQLCLSDEAAVYKIELQAKSGKSDVDAMELCKWVCHFVTRQASDSLLSRLIAGDLIVVFASGGRCTDSTRPLLCKFGNIKVHDGLSANIADPILQSLESLASKLPQKTKLEKDRKKHVSSLALELKSNRKTLIQALRRIVIWESITTDRMEEKLTGALTRKHRIPLLACSRVISDLEKAVRAARDKRGDVLPQVKLILAAKSARSLLGDEPHVILGHEKELCSQLKEQNVLLLTGRSQCGKTNMAKYIAASYQGQGVAARRGQDVSEARRFLTSANEEPRLFLLEDPFNEGDRTVVLETGESLRRLTSELRTHRFLIVTSKLDAITAIDNLLPRGQWNDLTIRDNDLLLEFWGKRCAINNAAKALESTLRDGLAKESTDDLLQPGHLLHLSHQPNTEGLDFEKLVRLARFDIVTQSHKLADRTPASRIVHIGLRIGASTLTQISTDDLAYIISDSDERPGLDKAQWVQLFGPVEESEFPKAPLLPELPDTALQELEFLHQLGHIRASAEGIEFTHPDYFAVSTEILASTSILMLQRVLNVLDRGLASLSESTALNSATTLRVVRQRLGTSEGARDEIFETALNASKSIFPAVRDSVVDELIDWLPSLRKEQRRKVLWMIEEADVSNYRIRWHGDTPWISSSGNSIESLFRELPSQNPDDDALLSSLGAENASHALTPREAFGLLDYAEAHPNAIEDSRVLVELANQSHAFIRKKAIELLILRNVNDPGVYLKTLTEERTPSVLSAVIRLCFNRWTTANQETRESLLPWLLEALSRTHVAILCSTLLLDFGDPYSTGSPNWEEMSDLDSRRQWALWAALFSVYLDTIADQPFTHNGAHMHRTLMICCSKLDREALDQVTESWIGWIEGQLEMRGLDDYELPVVEFLLETSDPGEARERLITRMLDHPDTGFVITTVSCMIDGWDFLSENEILVLLDRFDCERVDCRWIRAVALTRSVVPPAIQRALAGCDDLLVTSDSVLRNAPPQLLSDALHVFCGEPQPLWWYGTHHRAKELWQAVLKGVLNDCSHPDFDLAIREMLRGSIGSRDEGWSDALEIWQHLVNSADEMLRARLYDHLLYYSVSINNPQMIGFWPILFDAMVTEEEIRNFSSKILANLGMISRNVNSVPEFFGETPFRNFIYPRLDQEIEVVRLCLALENANSAEMQRDLLRALRPIFIERPPRLFSLYARVKAAVGNLQTEEAQATLSALEAARREFIEESGKRRPELDEGSEIWCWTEACRER